jgi:methionine biosynthesis protein MetW
MKPGAKRFRVDFDVIEAWVAPEARILDLGCGDGTLLARLRDGKRISGYGVEISVQNIIACLDKGVPVIQADLDTGLQDFEPDSVDFVVLSQTLQAIRYPHYLLREMLRVGREAIVSFPNIGHWLARAQLGLGGRMPRTPSLPYNWYNTPNIHLHTLRDFESLCHKEDIEILERRVIDRRGRSGLLAREIPNLFGATAMYRLQRGPGMSL